MKSNTDFKGVRNWVSQNYIFLIFAVISLGGIMMFMVVAAIQGVSALDWLDMENNSKWTAMDYFRCLLYNQDLDTAFSIHALYPPLVVLHYNYIDRISSLCGIAEYGVDAGWSVISMPYQLMIYVIYVAVALVIIYFGISHLNISKTKQFVLYIGILLSAPMAAGAAERGNCIIYAVAFSLLALAWKDQDNKVKREMSLIFIALAAGIKVYPAVMGLVYLKEKRFKEAFRLVIYGVIALVCPFALTGGVEAVKLFLNALFKRATAVDVGRIQCIKGVLVTVASGFGNEAGKTTDMLFLVIVICLVLLICCSRNRLRTAVYLAAFMAFVPSNAYRFTLLFFILPLFMLFTGEKNRADAIVASVCLALVFTIPTLWGLATRFKLNYGLYTLTYVEVAIYVPAYLLTAYCALRDVMEIGSPFGSNFFSTNV